MWQVHVKGTYHSVLCIGNPLNVSNCQQTHFAYAPKWMYRNKECLVSIRSQQIFL